MRYGGDASNKLQIQSLIKCTQEEKEKRIQKIIKDMETTLLECFDPNFVTAFVQWFIYE